jgi:CheY-like chemotaxis protein
MDGVSAFKRIRAMSGKRTSSPVTAVTETVLTESQQEMEELGMNGILAKPFHQSDLREVLHGAVQRLR